MWGAHQDAPSRVLPDVHFAGKDSQEAEYWETQYFQQWGPVPFTCFLSGKTHSFRVLPVISLSNTENSHNCPSLYFPKYKNKGKKFRYSSAFALKIYSD